MVPLPPSEITDPYFAAYITSFVRAVIGEILNSLPPRVCVFSCTTDGFLTNASAAEIENAITGPVASAFRSTRALLTGEPSVLEIKHQIRRPLGWRTRGQATLARGTVEGPTSIVLAKGGLHLADQFAARWSGGMPKSFGCSLIGRQEDRLTFETLTGIRDIVEFDADLVRKEVSRRVNMEYDWKRRPDILFDHEAYKHCAFSTVPWDTVEQFITVRELFEKYLDSNPHCIKSVGDFDSFSVYVDANMQLPEDQRRYLKRRAGDVKRLRMALCAAWHRDELGLRSNTAITTAQEFAGTLSACGVPCDRTHVENGKKQTFVPNSVPPTDSVLAAITMLQNLYQMSRRTGFARPDAAASIHFVLDHITDLQARRLVLRGVCIFRGLVGFGPTLQPDDEMKRLFELPGSLCRATMGAAD